MFKFLIPEDGHLTHSKTVVLQPLPGIGDMVWYLPVLRAIAADDPSGKIDLIAHEKLPLPAFLGSEGFIDRYLSLPVGRSMGKRIKNLRFLIRALKGQGYERAIVLHHSWRYTLAMWWAGIPHIYAYGLGHQKLFVTQKTYLPLKDRKVFPLYRANQLLGMLGIAVDPRPPHLHPLPETIQQVEEIYGAYPKPWSFFGIGATQANKIWLPERFAAVADALQDAKHGTIFLVGAPHEQAHAQAIIDHCQRAKPVAVTNLPLNQAIALISRCSLGFCNDSGLMNVSAAVGVSTYGLYLTTPALDYSPLLHAITPDEGVGEPNTELSPFIACRKISVERVLDKLRADGVLNNARLDEAG